MVSKVAVETFRLLTITLIEYDTYPIADGESTCKQKKLENKNKNKDNDTATRQFESNWSTVYSIKKFELKHILCHADKLLLVKFNNLTCKHMTDIILSKYIPQYSFSSTFQRQNQQRF